MKLSELKIGEMAKVVGIDGHSKERQHLLNMGLIPGVEIKMIKHAPMGDPHEIEIRGYKLALRNSHAKKINIEKISAKEYKNNNDYQNCNDYESMSKNNQPKNQNIVDLYNLSKIHNCELCRRNCKHNPNIIKNNKVKKIHSGEALKNELINETEHPGLGEAGRFHKKSEADPLPDSKTLSFVLAGNQNSGKTTLFNALTGSNQHVGNFPGVTIDKISGSIKGHKNTNITDLPGVYSLSPYSKEEVITREFILNEDVDCIINIIDATNIQRSLYLTMQLLELEHPVVIALNMMDELSKNDATILINKLENSIGAPVVPISAINNEGVDELVDHAVHLAKFQELPLKHDFCSADDNGGYVHRALHSIMHIIEDHCLLNKKVEHKHKVPIRFAAEKIAEQDELIFKLLKLNEQDKKAIEHILKHMEEESNLDRNALIAQMRYSFISKICDLCVIKGNQSIQRKRTEAADKILTGKWTGIPAFIIIIGSVFLLTFNIIGPFFQSLLDEGISWLSHQCMSFMQANNLGDGAQSFVSNAIFNGVGTIVSFLPIIIVMFFFLSILEDSGYMARVAFVMDKALRKIGLSGRSIVPMLIGFGCSVPAIMATRTLPSERDRRLTILLVPYMSCSAKLPIYAFISVLFFPTSSGLVILLLYVLGILIGILVALLNKGKAKPVPFIMELPNYRIPAVKNVIHLLWDKCKDFIQRAFTVILVATIIIWFLQSYNSSLVFVEDTSLSILANIAGFISPIFAPIGLGDWRIVTSLISGFLMKESVVSSLAVLYSGAYEITANIGPAVAVSFLVFCLLYTPCIAAINSVRRELGVKWALFVVLAQCLLAWLVSFVVYWIIIFMNVF